MSLTRRILESTRAGLSQLTSLVMRLGAVPPGLDEPGLSVDLAEFVNHYANQPVDAFDRVGTAAPQEPTVGADDREGMLTSLGGTCGARARPLDRVGHGVPGMAPAQPSEHFRDRLASGLAQGLRILGLVRPDGASGAHGRRRRGLTAERASP